MQEEDPGVHRRARGKCDTSLSRGEHTAWGPVQGMVREAQVEMREGPEGGSGQCCGLMVSSLS